MPALAFGMTKFVIVPELQKSLGIKDQPEAGRHRSPNPEGSPDAKKEFRAVSTNCWSTSPAPWASAICWSAVTVVGTGGEEFKTKMAETTRQLRDMALGTLVHQNAGRPRKTRRAQSHPHRADQRFQQRARRQSVVQEIYITEFGLQ